jgi:hypothetical protein
VLGIIEAGLLKHGFTELSKCGGIVGRELERILVCRLRFCMAALFLQAPGQQQAEFVIVRRGTQSATKYFLSFAIPLKLPEDPTVTNVGACLARMLSDARCSDGLCFDDAAQKRQCRGGAYLGAAVTGVARENVLKYLECLGLAFASK